MYFNKITNVFLLLQGDEYYHDLENVDANDTGIELSTSSIVDGGGDSTDISESMSYDTCSLSEDVASLDSASSSKDTSPEHRSHTLPAKLAVKQLEWDEIDELLQVERKVDDSGKLYRTMPSPLPSQTSLDLENDSSLTLTQDFKSLDLATLSSPSASRITISSANDHTTTTTTTTAEYLTPNSTLKNVDYDLFKQQMHEEYINNSNQLQSMNDSTLKSNQPIDPSRINDSLKLYSENMMSKSFSGTTTDLRVCPTTIQYQTLGAIDPQKLQDTFGLSRNPQIGSRNYLLQKSGSASSRIISSEHENWMEKGLNRSKSGPNWFENNNFSDSDNCETLKPSTIRKNHEIYNIKMDCYNDEFDAAGLSDGLLAVNGITDEATTPTTPTTPSTTTATTASAATNTGTNSQSSHGVSCDDCNRNEDGVVLRRPKTGSTAIKRRSGNKR